MIAPSTAALDRLVPKVSNVWVQPRGDLPKLIGQLAPDQSVIALAQVEPEFRQYEPRSETHSRRFGQRGWLSAAEQHGRVLLPLATRSRGGGFARSARDGTLLFSLSPTNGGPRGAARTR